MIDYRPRGKIQDLMHYPRVVALIDAEIHRLLTVRTLLLPLETPLGKTRQKRTSNVSAAAEIPMEAVGVSEEVAKAAKPLPFAKGSFAREKSLQKERKARKPIPKKKDAGQPVTALSGAVPADPVFVSANQMRSAQAQKQTSASADQNGSAIAPRETLTAELLSQRWLRLHSSVS